MPKQIPFYGTREEERGEGRWDEGRARPSELSLIGVVVGGGVSGVATQASGIPPLRGETSDRQTAPNKKKWEG